MCGTLAIIARTCGVSSWMTVWCIRRRPSAFTVASCLGLSPMIDRHSETLSLLLGTDRLLHQVAVAAAAAGGVQVLQPLDAPERVERGLEDVVRIVRSQRLGQDVLNTGRLQHRPHGAAGDDAGPRYRGLEEHPAGPEVAGDLAGDGGLLERHEDQVLLGVLDRLADRLRHLVGLAEADADVAAAVADDDQRREREAPAAL